VALTRLLRRRERLVELRVPGFDHTVWARPEGSDRASFEHVFDGAYDLDLSEEPRLIVDLGANAGYAAVFFALCYPTARILAVEPVPANAAILRRNAAPFERLDVVEAAAWPHPARLALVDPGKGYWGIRVAPDATGKVTAVTIPELLVRAGRDTIDLLKIDIEGAERQLFGQHTEWLTQVRVLVVELHDRFVPGCRAALAAAVRRSGVHFEEEQRGTDVILRTAQTLRSGL
jgi:FkbM family methyltransferase